MRTAMIAFRRNGSAYFVAVAGDSTYGALHIWKEIGRKYKIIGKKQVPNLIIDVPKIKKLIETDLLTDDEYYVLQSTFDNKVIPSTMFHRVALALERFRPVSVNLARQSFILKSAAEQNVRAVMVVQFTMGDDLWYNHKLKRSYNLDYDDSHSVMVIRE